MRLPCFVKVPTPAVHSVPQPRLWRQPMLHRLVSILALATAFLVTPAQAQKVDPGLWEMTNDFDIPGLQEQMAQMRAAMENVPPELRAQMEAQMAQAGVGLMGGGTMQVC